MTASTPPDDGNAPPPAGSLKARNDVVSRQVGDEWVLYDPVSQKMHVLNVTTGIVWNLLDGAHTFDELVQATREAFDPAPAADVIARDIEKLLEQLAAEGLLA